jgi:hypothetical protein
MDPFDDDEIVLLLRLKRDEQPPASYYENFLSEFRRRQRDQLLRQPLLSICLDRVQNFVLRLDVFPLAPYPAAVVAVLVCGAVVSIRIYQQPEPAQVTHRSSSIPNALANAEIESFLRASGFDSEDQWESDFSSCKEEYPVAAD